MTDDEREALAARMQQAYQTKRSELFSLGLPPSGSTEDACMLAALAVAEPVVREDEREACARVADGSPSLSHRHIAAAIRARGAA